MNIPEKNKRIRQLIDIKTNGSVNKFSKKINISQPRMSRLFNFDKKIDKYSPVFIDIIDAIINIFVDINIEWLMTGRGEMLKTARQEAVISAPVCFQSCRYISDLRYTIEVQKKINWYFKQCKQICVKFSIFNFQLSIINERLRRKKTKKNDYRRFSLFLFLVRFHCSPLRLICN